MIFRVKARQPLSRRTLPASPKVQRRRERTRAALLAAGARQFARRGVAPVSVEDLIAEADISRATFYGLFSSKYSLLEGILNPIFDVAVREVAALAARPAAEAIDGLVDLYWSLWTTHREGFLLIPSVDTETFKRFEPQHRALQEALLALLQKAERAELLRNASAHYSLKVLARTAVQLLRVYDGHPAAAALFRDALRGLLLRSH
jgi:AcrR family transcriptional regulator